MKYLLVLAVVLVAFWIWRNNRLPPRSDAPDRPAGPKPPAPSVPDEMVACRHCGVHLPRADAVRGALGPYCGHEHRRLAEG